MVLCGIFLAATFLGSALLFLVEPMVARMILPTFGGASGVWNTCLVFFQAMLLAGYGYAHLSTRALGVRRQACLHALLLLVPLLVLPMSLPAVASPSGIAAAPVSSLLTILFSMVGIPFFVLSAGAPLLQKWLSATRAKWAKDPYFLYAASNFGSMAALLAYPLVVEPRLRLVAQNRLWTWGYAALVLLMISAAVGLWRRGTGEETAAGPAGNAPAPSGGQRALWTLLAAVPSSLLLGVTAYLTTNVAAIPLLWVIPLALYLGTYILAFSRGSSALPRRLDRFLGAALAPMVLVLLLEASRPIWIMGTLHLALFTAAALFCHGRLAGLRPHTAHLTEFYVWISVGGVLGGAFNAFLAPLVFRTVAEYPTALVLLLLLRQPREPGKKFRPGDLPYALAVTAVMLVALFAVENSGLPPSPARSLLVAGLPLAVAYFAVDRPVRYALSLGGILLVGAFFHTATPGTLLSVQRGFYGVHRVVRTPDGRFHTLLHGNTVHGCQSTDPARRREALSYYHRSGPGGQAFTRLNEAGRLRGAGLVGLGVGALAAYGRPGQRFTFFEIDPLVERIATDRRLFTYVPDCQAACRIVLGDARLSLARWPDRSFDALVLDAFSSDAIPVHIMTREAISLYLNKLRPGGILLFHVSNLYLDLRGPLAASARDLGLAALVQDDLSVTEEERRDGKDPSVWILMAASAGDLRPFAGDPRWRPLAAGGCPAWTDDYSNILGVFRFRP